MKKTWWGALALVCCLSAGCNGCGGDREVVTSEPTAASATPDATPAPVDPMLASVSELAARVSALPPAEGADLAPREVFRREALTLGNQAIDQTRIDVAVGVAEALWLAGETKTAAAFLQRAVGKTSGEQGGGKAHMHALARLKVEQGLALEAASLMERAIDIEPTSPADFGLLSWAYLRAGRSGPAAAATRRGLRAHPGDSSLAVHAAEVLLVTEGAAPALAALAAIEPTPGSLDYLRVRGEANIVSGDVASAKADGNSIVQAFPDSPWGPMLVGVSGGPGSADEIGRARAAASVRLADVDARSALAWASVTEGTRAPWPRFTESVPAGAVPTP